VITQDDAEKAVDWLRANARKMAQERAERLYLEQWIKTVKAQLQVESPAPSAARAEMIALASPKYLAALQAYKQAVEADEYNRFMVTAAEAKIEAWRSQESTRRAEGKAYT
jgi:alpha/beta superfamily hydrolase